MPTAEQGDYERAPINRSLVNTLADNNEKAINQALTNLSDDDRANFEDYHEGTKDINQADDPEAVQHASDLATKGFDVGNALDHAVGGDTPHIDKYFPGYVDKTDPEAQAKMEAETETEIEEEVGAKKWQNMTLDQRREMIENRMGEKQGESVARDDENFGGYKNQARVFANRAERQAAGVKDAYDDPRDAIHRYFSGLKYKIGNDAFSKAAQEADMGQKGSPFKSIDLAPGKRTPQLTEKAYKALKDNDMNTGKNLLIKVNRAAKQANIALGVPHAVIIPPRFLGALSELKGSTAVHSGLQDIFNDASDLSKVPDKATTPEIEEFGARVGSPIRSERINAGVSDVKTGMKFNPLTAPKRVVYNWLLPKMHATLLNALKENLDARGIDYDSAEARSYGKQINDVMGYSKNSHSAFDESTFAPSLIKSTANLYRKSLTPSGSIARGGVAGQQLVNQAVGFISKAISNKVLTDEGQSKNKIKDSFWGTVIKETLSPSVYTPYRNSKGEQISLGIPGQYQAEAARIPLALNRNSKGQLKVGVNSLPQALTNLVQTGKDIASPVLGAGLSAVTNQTYNGTQVRNPYATPLTQLEQTGVNSALGALPINLQTPADEAASKILPPKFNQDIPNNTTGSTALRVASQTFGLNPKADTTTGQGPAITQWYAGQTKGQDFIAANSNNSATQQANMDLYNKYFDRTHNDAGQTIMLNQAQTASNWSDLSSNPTVMKAVQIAEQAQGKGNYDPEWDLNSQQLQQYAVYKSLAPGDPERDVLAQQNPWITQTEQASINWAAQQTFGGKAVNGPGYVPYPSIPNNVNDMMTQVTQLASIPAAQRTPAQIQQLQTLENSPDLQNAYQSLDQYTNAVRKEMGQTPINYIPNEPPAVSNWANQYENPGGDAAQVKAERDTMRTQDPNMYAAMQQAYENSDLGSLEKQASIAYLSGTPSDELLSAIYNLGAYDVNKTANKNGTSTYSLTNFGGLPLANSNLPTLNSVNGYAPSSFSQSSYAKGSGSSSEPLVPLPKIKHQKQPKMKKPPHLKGFKAPHIRKQPRVKVQTQGIQHTNVLKPTAVVKLAH